MTKPDGALESVLRVLRRRKIIFLVALISVPLAAYVVSSSETKEYTATATLLFESGEAGTTEASREAATNEALAGLPVVAVRTAKAMGGGITAGEVLASVTASSANEMANLTTISAITPSPELSAQIANAYSRAYVAFRRESDQTQINRVIALVEKSLESLSPEKAAGPQGQVLHERLSQLEVEQALKTGKTELVQTAGVPSTPSKPKTHRNVIVGVILGAILGLALAALLERIDRRVRTVEELEELFGLPILARIPRSRALGQPRIDLMLQAPEAEAFRTLRTNLRYFNIDNGLKSILIASPEPDDGKSTVSRGLAGAMAEVGDRVILIEADLRKESAFRDSTGRALDGLSGVLAGVPLERALITMPVSVAQVESPRTLTVLPSGPIPPNPSELLESDGMRELIAQLSEQFEVVVIDSPALGVVSDALTLARVSSEILAVGGLGKTSRDGIANFLSQLELMKKEPLGLIATMTDLERNKYSYYQRSRPMLRR